MDAAVYAAKPRARIVLRNAYFVLQLLKFAIRNNLSLSTIKKLKVL
jgi:hypothetical protein